MTSLLLLSYSATAIHFKERFYLLNGLILETGCAERNVNQDFLRMFHLPAEDVDTIQSIISTLESESLNEVEKTKIYKIITAIKQSNQINVFVQFLSQHKIGSQSALHVLFNQWGQYAVETESHKTTRFKLLSNLLLGSRMSDENVMLVIDALNKATTGDRIKIDVNIQKQMGYLIINVGLDYFSEEVLSGVKRIMLPSIGKKDDQKKMDLARKKLGIPLSE